MKQERKKNISDVQLTSKEPERKKWIEHVFRMKSDSLPRTALTLTQEDRWKNGHQWEHDEEHLRERYYFNLNLVN